MKLLELFRRLLHNWPIKLAALLTATILWYQLREVEPVVERSLQRPLEVVGVDAERRPVGLPKQVLVRLRGTSRIINNLHPNAVVAFVDLSGVEAGQFTVPVQVRVPSGVSVVEVVPAEISAILEKQAAAVLPVDVYTPGSAVDYAPKSVDVTGAAGLVAKAKVAVGINIGSREKVSLVVLDENGLPIEGLKVKPPQATVKVIGPLLTKKEVKLVLAPPPDDLRLAGIQIPEKVVLVGPADKLAGIKRVVADADWRVGEYQTALKLKLPQGVQAVGAVLAKLKVEPAVLLR
ncbi:CdaR family protein [Oceanithermus sp.]